MSLSSKVNDLAERLAQEFNAVRADLANAGASVTISETAPTGDETTWFNSTNGSFYIKYEDAWVAVSGPAGPQGEPGPAVQAPLTLTQSSNNASHPLTISSANQQTSGNGYVDVIKLTNSKSGATKPHKFLRLSDSGALQILNSDYSSALLSITDGGLTTVQAASGVSNNTPTANAISLNNHSFIFDDGNMHLNANDGAIWINSNGGSPVQINTQGSAAGGGLVVGGTVSASNIADSGWIDVTSTQNNYGAYNSVGYRKINGVVYLRGAVANGTANTTAFNLPSGYRPAYDVVVPCQKFGSSGLDYLTISSNGNVTPNSTAAWLSSAIFPAG